MFCPHNFRGRQRKKLLICVFNEQISCSKTVDTIGRDSVKTTVDIETFVHWFSKTILQKLSTTRNELNHNNSNICNPYESNVSISNSNGFFFF